MTTIDIELDDKLLEDSKKLFNNLNIDLNDAIVDFLKKCILVNNLPFSYDKSEIEKKL